MAKPASTRASAAPYSSATVPLEEWHRQALNRSQDAGSARARLKELRSQKVRFDDGDNALAQSGPFVKEDTTRLAAARFSKAREGMSVQELAQEDVFVGSIPEEPGAAGGSAKPAVKAPALPAGRPQRRPPSPHGAVAPDEPAWYSQVRAAQRPDRFQFSPGAADLSQVDQYVDQRSAKEALHHMQHAPATDATSAGRATRRSLAGRSEMVVSRDIARKNKMLSAAHDSVPISTTHSTQRVPVQSMLLDAATPRSVAEADELARANDMALLSAGEVQRKAQSVMVAQTAARDRDDGGVHAGAGLALWLLQASSYGSTTHLFMGQALRALSDLLRAGLGADFGTMPAHTEVAHLQLPHVSVHVAVHELEKGGSTAHQVSVAGHADAASLAALAAQYSALVSVLRVPVPSAGKPAQRGQVQPMYADLHAYDDAAQQRKAAFARMAAAMPCDEQRAAAGLVAHHLPCIAEYMQPHRAEAISSAVREAVVEVGRARGHAAAAQKLVISRVTDMLTKERALQQHTAEGIRAVLFQLHCQVLDRLNATRNTSVSVAKQLLQACMKLAKNAGIPVAADTATLALASSADTLAAAQQLAITHSLERFRSARAQRAAEKRAKKGAPPSASMRRSSGKRLSVFADVANALKRDSVLALSGPPTGAGAAAAGARASFSSQLGTISEGRGAMPGAGRASAAPGAEDEPRLAESESTWRAAWQAGLAAIADSAADADESASMSQLQAVWSELTETDPALRYVQALLQAGAALLLAVERAARSGIAAKRSFTASKLTRRGSVMLANAFGTALPLARRASVMSSGRKLLLQQQVKRVLAERARLRTELEAKKSTWNHARARWESLWATLERVTGQLQRAEAEQARVRAAAAQAEHDPERDERQLADQRAASKRAAEQVMRLARTGAQRIATATRARFDQELERTAATYQQDAEARVDAWLRVITRDVHLVVPATVAAVYPRVMLLKRQVKALSQVHTVLPRVRMLAGVGASGVSGASAHVTMLRVLNALSKPPSSTASAAPAPLRLSITRSKDLQQVPSSALSWLQQLWKLWAAMDAPPSAQAAWLAGVLTRALGQWTKTLTSASSDSADQAATSLRVRVLAQAVCALSGPGAKASPVQRLAVLLEAYSVAASGLDSMSPEPVLQASMVSGVDPKAREAAAARRISRRAVAPLSPAHDSRLRAEAPGPSELMPRQQRERPKPTPTQTTSSTPARRATTTQRTGGQSPARRAVATQRSDQQYTYSALCMGSYNVKHMSSTRHGQAADPRLTAMWQQATGLQSTSTSRSGGMRGAPEQRRSASAGRAGRGRSQAEPARYGARQRSASATRERPAPAAQSSPRARPSSRASSTASYRAQFSAHAMMHSMAASPSHVSSSSRPGMFTSTPRQRRRTMA